MPSTNSTLIDGLLSTPLLLPAPIAGALAALFLVLVVVSVRSAVGGGGPRVPILLGTSVIAVVAFISLFVVNEHATEQRALLQRNVDLGLSTISSGSALACLDGLIGEEIENACEKAVFADPQSTARAVAYVAARLSLLADAARIAKEGGPDLQAAFTSTRRAIEIDRYGIAAHVLAERDGCTADHCGPFALLRDTTTLKANLKVNAFDTYVARYAANWGKTEPDAERQPQATGTTTAPVAGAPEPLSPTHPLDSRYDFPSAASIPPVSIMNAEPSAKPSGAPAAVAAEKPAGSAAPVPPKRPQAQALSPPAR